MNIREQCWIVLLYALIELDGEGTKQEVLAHIQQHKYWHADDTNDNHPDSRPNECSWRNEFSFGRQHMVEQGYMEKAERGVWRISKKGRQYFANLKNKLLSVDNPSDMRFTSTFSDQIREVLQTSEEEADKELMAVLVSLSDSNDGILQNEDEQQDDSPKPKGNHYKYAAGKRVYQRDPKIARRALESAEYLCEIEPMHPSFLRRNSQKRYMEPHHLVPMSMTDHYNVSLDREQNIFCLCSNCHNQIHYGTHEDVRAMLKVLLESRLQNIRGILGYEITLDEIYDIYKVR